MKYIEKKLGSFIINRVLSHPIISALEFMGTVSNTHRQRPLLENKDDNGK